MNDDDDGHDNIQCDLCLNRFTIYAVVVLPECGEVYCNGCVEEMVHFCKGATV